MAIQADGTQMNDGISSAYPESGRSQSKRVLVVFNPKAGRRRLGKLRRTIAAMRLTGAASAVWAAGGAILCCDVDAPKRRFRSSARRFLGSRASAA